MRQDKELIFKLRQEGKTFRQIQRETGVSRATLSLWFRGVSWSRQLTINHERQNSVASRDRIAKMHMVRRLKLQYKYALAESDAKKEYEVFKNEPLFLGGLMIYATAGDKSSRGLIRLSSGDFYIHKLFISFLDKYLGIPKESIRFSLILHEEEGVNLYKQVWIDRLHFSSDRFYKTQIIKGKKGVKRLQYGVGMSIIPNTLLKRKLLKWISLVGEDHFT